LTRRGSRAKPPCFFAGLTVLDAMNKDSPPAKLVVCPSCAGPSLYAPSNPFRPFCCARCKNIDLGAWASEDFRLPADRTPDEFSDDPKSP
jgi:endogenous inhibitor of DNA gyrase (YacG/DUF329 family)